MAKTKFKHHSNLGKVKKKITKETEERVEEATHHFRDEILETLSGERSGKEYRVPGTSVYYTASAPGEPPASRLGHLRGSVDWEVIKKGALFGKTEIVGRVGTPLEYGAKLETGEYPASDKPNSAVARPWMYPTYKRELKTIKRILGGSSWF